MEAHSEVHLMMRQNVENAAEMGSDEKYFKRNGLLHQVVYRTQQR